MYYFVVLSENVKEIVFLHVNQFPSANPFFSFRGEHVGILFVLVKICNCGGCGVGGGGWLRLRVSLYFTIFSTYTQRN